jgi:hypothetical protein
MSAKTDTIYFFAKKYPKETGTGSNFANGGYSVKRSETWLQEYKRDVEKAVDITNYNPWTYGWFRTLDDGGHHLYGVACRALNVCTVCYLEWGQPYYANNCKHPRTRNPNSRPIFIRN